MYPTFVSKTMELCVCVCVCSIYQPTQGINIPATHTSSFSDSFIPLWVFAMCQMYKYKIRRYISYSQVAHILE